MIIWEKVGSEDCGGCNQSGNLLPEFAALWCTFRRPRSTPADGDSHAPLRPAKLPETFCGKLRGHGYKRLLLVVVSRSA